MERLSDPVFAFLEDNPEIKDILFRKADGKKWYFRTNEKSKSARIFLEDIFYCHSLPYLNGAVSGELYSVHYHREENGEPLRTIIFKP